MNTDTSMTEAQAMACLQRAAKRRDREMLELRKQGAISRRNGQRYLRKVIHRRDVILATAVDQFQKWGRGVGTEDGPSALEVIAFAGKLDPWKPTSESVRVVEKQRLNDKTRRYFKLGLVESIRQLLLYRVAKALAVFHPYQFGLSGGRPSVVRWLTEFLGEAELVMTTDIPDFFHRANRASMESGLPLPRRVTLAALFAIMDRAEAVKWSKDMLSVPGTLSCLPETSIVAVSPKGRGTPSGAALSQIAADILIREILLAVEAAVPGVRAGAYGDNLIFILPDASQRASVIEALTSAVQHHVGEDVISGLTDRIRSTKPSSWFQFCGVEYRWSKSALTQRTTEERMDNYAVRFLTKVSDAKTDEEYDGLRRSLRSWIGQYQQLPNALDFALELASHLPPTKSG